MHLCQRESDDDDDDALTWEENSGLRAPKPTYPLGAKSAQAYLPFRLLFRINCWTGQKEKPYELKWLRGGRGES